MATFSEVSDIVDESTASELLQRFGGGHISLPTCIHAKTPVIDILGSFSESIIYQLGGSRIYVPMMRDKAIQRRNSRIYADRDAGVSVAQLASRYQLCERSVYKILERRPKTIDNN